jgi:hypothetical protein
MAWTFNYGVRIDFEDLVPALRDSTEYARFDALVQVANIDLLVEAALLPGGLAWKYAESALVGRWDDTPLDYARDIAPRIRLRVELVEIERQEKHPSDGCVFFRCFVECDDHDLALKIAQDAANEWEDGDMDDYGFRQVEGTV